MFRQSFSLLLVGFVLILLSQVLRPAAAAPAEEFSGRTVRVLDGDTIEALRSGSAVRIRLSGVDAPEKTQAFGMKAKEFTVGLAAGKTVVVKVRDVDRYGRLVAEVILPDGRSLNSEMVRSGFAWWYERYAPKDVRLARLEREARMAERGLWSDRRPQAPWEFRKAGRHGSRSR